MRRQNDTRLTSLYVCLSTLTLVVGGYQAGGRLLISARVSEVSDGVALEQRRYLALSAAAAASSRRVGGRRVALDVRQQISRTVVVVVAGAASSTCRLVRRRLAPALRRLLHRLAV